MAFATKKGETFKERIIPEGYEFGMSVLVGHAVNREGAPHEADMSKVTYIG